MRISFFAKRNDHPTNKSVVGARSKDCQASFVGTPFEDIDIDVSHAPPPHRQAISFVKIDRARAHERAAVIIDFKSFVGIDDAKSSAERETRPIRGGAKDIVSGKFDPNGIIPPASFGVRVRGSANLGKSLHAGFAT